MYRAFVECSTPSSNPLAFRKLHAWIPLFRSVYVFRSSWTLSPVVDSCNAAKMTFLKPLITFSGKCSSLYVKRTSKKPSTKNIIFCYVRRTTTLTWRRWRITSICQTANFWQTPRNHPHHLFPNSYRCICSRLAASPLQLILIGCPDRKLDPGRMVQAY